jgi:hypothetical protein
LFRLITIEVVGIKIDREQNSKKTGRIIHKSPIKNSMFKRKSKISERTKDSTDELATNDRK